MKLKEGMIIRLKNHIGRHNKGDIVKIIYIISLTAFCENTLNGEKLVIPRESDEVEDLNEVVFNV